MAVSVNKQNTLKSVLSNVSDGTDIAEVINLASNDALSVAVVDASGNQITSFGAIGLTDAELRASPVNVVLTAGTAGIGKLTANSGVDIGDVDVTSLPALPVGSNVIGKVSIDQTTPGTTNLVQVGGSLPAGTNAIGKLSANSGVDIGDVDVTSLPALPTGTNVIGKTRGTSASFFVTLVLDTAAYAAGDVLAVPQVISSVMSANAGTALLHSIIINDKDDQGQALDIVMLKTNVSLGTINNAVSISDANADEILGIVSFAAGDFIDLGGCRVATKTGVGLVCKSGAASQDLYVGAISRGTGTYTASGITVQFGFASVD